METTDSTCQLNTAFAICLPNATAMKRENWNYLARY